MTRVQGMSALRVAMSAVLLCAAGCGQEGVEDGAGPEAVPAEAEESEVAEADEADEHDLLAALAPAEPEEASEVLAAAAASTDAQDEAACRAAIDPNQAVVHAPCGSYAQTCNRFSAWGIYGDQFCADCKDKRGGTRRTCLTKAACPEWFASNDDGALRCGTKPVAARVSNVSGLVAALARARQCTRIEIDGRARLDLSAVVARGSLRIPRGVTLAGGPDGSTVRPLLTMRQGADGRAMFEAAGADVRITGLRLQGPDQKIGTKGQPTSTGIRANGQHGLQVDHSELLGWQYAAIYLKQSRYAFIHHDAIHHNRRAGLGYGVCLDASSSALIEHNEFNANRHAVAGTGHPDVLYLARYNRAGRDVQKDGQVFDMHGIYEKEGVYARKPWAGCLIEIYGNTFLSGDARAPGVYIRGIPASARGVEIHDNCFAHATPQIAAKQELRTKMGNVDWAYYRAKYPGLHWHLESDNRYGVANGTCHVER